MFDKKKIEEAKTLLRRAYALGFEVGYYRHYESVGWVKKELRRLEEEAEKLGIKKRLLDIYLKGKADGERKRSILQAGEEIPVLRVPRERRAFTEEARRTPISRIIISWRAHIRPAFMNLPRFLRRRNQF